VTDWSDIPIKAGNTIDWHVGFRVYSGDKANNPNVRGYDEYLQLTVLQGASKSLWLASLPLVALLTSSLF